MLFFKHDYDELWAALVAAHGRFELGLRAKPTLSCIYSWFIKAASIATIVQWPFGRSSTLEDLGPDVDWRGRGGREWSF